MRDLSSFAEKSEVLQWLEPDEQAEEVGLVLVLLELVRLAASSFSLCRRSSVSRAA